MKKAIPTCRFYEFKARVEKLNKKLVKLNKPILTVTELDHFIRKEKVEFHNSGDAYRNDTFRDFNVEYANIQIDGLEFFKKDDSKYKYIGTVNVKDGVKTVFCPDNTFLLHFQSDSNVCDHCHTKRLRNTYHLFEDHGRVLKIGSSCAKDFFGYDVDKILHVYYETFAVIRSFEEFDEKCCRESISWSFNEIYSEVQHYTKDFSFWDSSGKSEIGTSQKIREDLYTNSTYSMNSKAPEELLQKIRNYWDSQDLNSSFVLNMREAIKHDYAIEKNVGSYAYAIFGAIKGMKEKEASLEGNECQYKDGDRPGLNLTVTHRHSFTAPGYSRYAKEETIYVVEFLSEDGVIYVTKSSSGAISELNIGDKVKLAGTICGRNDFAGKKRWQLKRCKVKEVGTPKKGENTGKVEDLLKALELLD